MREIIIIIIVVIVIIELVVSTLFYPDFNEKKRRFFLFYHQHFHINIVIIINKPCKQIKYYIFFVFVGRKQQQQQRNNRWKSIIESITNLEDKNEHRIADCQTIVIDWLSKQQQHLIPNDQGHLGLWKIEYSLNHHQRSINHHHTYTFPINQSIKRSIFIFAILK